MYIHVFCFVLLFLILGCNLRVSFHVVFMILYDLYDLYYLYYLYCSCYLHYLYRILCILAYINCILILSDLYAMLM